ncbi:hypothetical protein [Chlorogloea sp. CCALA 695]|uniref:hypothetical protein n=1 Tax=Chlorogloea sp. CCALA 695 TaxID=2107693 RepID=UPI001304D80A|nr:hypothetical protein [Chlorogloea sp. CCALA 695]
MKWAHCSFLVEPKKPQKTAENGVIGKRQFTANVSYLQLFTANIIYNPLLFLREN